MLGFILAIALVIYILIKLLYDLYVGDVIKINPKNPYDGFVIIETVRGKFFIQHKRKFIDKYPLVDKYIYCEYAYNAEMFWTLEEAVSKIDDIIKLNLAEPKIHKISKNLDLF
jgi:hypothetical protein